MATKSMRYDHSAYQARLVSFVPLPATAASTSVSKFVAFTDMKIKSINSIVKTAGTHTAAGYNIFNGTTSVGSVTAGTSAAASVLSQVATDITLSSGGYLDIKTKADSATLAADVTVEFELIPGAAVTS